MKAYFKAKTPYSNDLSGKHGTAWSEQKGTQTDNCCATRKDCRSHPCKLAPMWVGVLPPVPDVDYYFIAEERALETKGTSANLLSSRTSQSYNTQYLLTPLKQPARALKMHVFPF